MTDNTYVKFEATIDPRRLHEMREQAGKVAHSLGLTDNGEIDAFRHAYVSGKMREKWGTTIATSLGNLNEARFGNSPASKAMDELNNAWGREEIEQAHADVLNDSQFNNRTKEEKALEADRRFREALIADIKKSDGKLVTSKHDIPKINQRLAEEKYREVERARKRPFGPNPRPDQLAVPPAKIQERNERAGSLSDIFSQRDAAQMRASEKARHQQREVEKRRWLMERQQQIKARAAGASSGTVRVKGYTRADGVEVEPHMRRAPDDSKNK